MEDITKNNACISITRYVKLLVCPKEYVQSIDLVLDNKKTVTLKAGKRFYSIEANNIELSNKRDNGYYDNQLTCKLPVSGTNYDILLDQMCNQRFIVKIKDRSGKWWLLGSLEEPINFSFDNTGNVSDHVYNLLFSRNTTMPLFLTE